MQPGFPGGPPRWQPPGDLFGLAILGVFAGLVVVVIKLLAAHCR
jgi:hypothetical protein